MTSANSDGLQARQWEFASAPMSYLIGLTIPKLRIWMRNMTAGFSAN